MTMSVPFSVMSMTMAWAYQGTEQILTSIIFVTISWSSTEGPPVSQTLTGVLATAKPHVPVDVVHGGRFTRMPGHRNLGLKNMNSGRWN
jgi:hypothetical protein